MVNPTGHPLTGNADGLRLQAVNSETLRYLGQQVGKVIEARVIQVITQLPANSANASTDRANSPAGGRPDANRPGVSRPAANPAERYQLLLSIDNQRSIKVESSLAPRIGQILQLAVIDNQQLRIVSQGSPAAANTNVLPPTQAAPAHSAAANFPGSSNAALIPGGVKAGLIPPPAVSPASRPASGEVATGAALGQALRAALPRQTSRAELPAALAQLAAATPTAASRYAGAPTHATTALTSAMSSTMTPAMTPAKTSTMTPASTGNPNPVGSPNATAGTTALSNSARASAVQTGAAHGAATTGQASIPAQAATIQSAAVQAAARQLANAIPQATTLGDPAQLRAALLNSGVFYERKLADFAAQQRTLQNALQSAGKTSAEYATQNSRPAAIPTTAPLALDARARSALDTRLQGDIKGHVLTLARELKSALPSTALQPIQHTSGARGGELQGDPRGDIVLANLWQVINTAYSVASQPAHTRPDPVMQLLRLALGNSAHIQAQQLLAVGSQIASQSDPQLNQTLNLELPLWLDQRLAMVDVRVEREKASRDAQNKIETWNVRLRFDLEELGELTALATLQGKRMAAVMWASAAELTHKIQLELAAVASQLGELGLDVQHLHCRTGPAPEASAHSTINVLTMNLLDTQS